uniref:Outer capsid protein P3 n=1 Tax=Rice dwarf virus (isolate Akita) TaxID=142803 RepID=P3_RDVA|nr:RecName: Full=Outer capsid protein P3; AltName: Full=Core protein P3 [Rice dwarf virus (isolate Akita)]1UF2_A Chain A, Core protein P3 [Rice dwarf virus]1UF2_B Chain B, Core protein P3 [Rice dwarf virus]CAA38440.1 structural core protein [Rice dwarf virus]
MDSTGRAYDGASEFKSVLVTEGTSHYTPVEVYNILDELKTIKITSTIAEQSVVSRTPIPLSKIGLQDVKKLFDINVIKCGSSLRIVDEPQVTFIVSYAKDIYDKFMCIEHDSAYEPSLTMHRVRVIYSMLNDYCAKMISEVPYESSFVGELPVKSVTLNKLGDRNMDALAEHLLFEHDVVNAQRENRIFYQRKSAPAVPVIFGDDLEPAVRERANLYHRYSVPYHQIELALHALANDLLSIQYCHPTVVYNYLSSRAPNFLRLDDQVSLKLTSAGIGTLMPRPVVQLLDYDLVYMSPLALNNLASRLLRKISLHLVMQMVTAVQQDLGEVVSVSSNVTNPASACLVRMNVQGVQTLAVFIAQSMLNPNISYGMISGLTLDCFSNFIYGACLMLFQALIPPSALTARQRLDINNRFAYFLIKCHATQATTARLVANQVIYPVDAIDQWQSNGRDVLVAIYNNLLPGELVLTNLIQTYFRGNTAQQAAEILIPADQTSYGANETRALSAPYLFGAPINMLAPDARLSTYKRDLALPDRSPILITTVEGQNSISIENLRHKTGLIRAMYLNGFVTQPPAWIRNANSNTALLSRFLDATPNLLGIYEAILANTYANAVNVYCDSVYRADIPIEWKLHQSVDPQDLLFGVFGIVPQYQILNEAVPDFFAGGEDILILQLIRAVYDTLSNKLGRNPADIFHLEEVFKVIEEIVSVLVQQKIDVRKYFTESMRSGSFSKPRWDNFLRRPVAQRLPNLYSVIMTQADHVYNYMTQLTHIIPITDCFYIVKNSGFVDRGSTGPVIASSSVYENVLKVVHTIADFDAANALRLQRRRVDNTSYTDSLSDMFNGLRSISSSEFVRSVNGRSVFTEGRIDAIKVNMRAKFDLQFITEEGGYSKPPNVKKLMFSDFLSFLDSHKSDYRPPLLTVPITIGLNNLGETNSNTLRMRSEAIDEYFSSYVGAQILVPINVVDTRVYTEFSELRNFFTGDVVIRDDPFDVWDGVKATYIPIGVHGVRLDPNGDQPPL